MSGIEHILEGLNSSQKEAVTYGDGPLLIVAGAGTGKTRVITQRIAYLIASGKAEPEQILALTFTEKAAMEMEERVDILLPYGCTQVWIGTFHAFGNTILKENALEMGFSPELRVLNRPEQIIFFRNHLFEFSLSYYRPLGNPSKHIEAILALISRAKDEDVTPREYLEYAQKLKEEVESNPEDKELIEIATREEELALTYEKYQELLAREGKIDFGDQITLPLRLFRSHPAILKKYQRQFRYILVDEFQDTNYSQFQLIKLLGSEHQNIAVVGDDDQSIYKFRGAAISNILGFINTYSKAKQIVLTRNYRSPQSILDSAYRLISYNNPDRLEFKNNIDKRLVAEKKKEGRVEHLHFDTLFAEAEAVAKLIKNKQGSGSYKYGDFAILIRANSNADPFLRALNMADIPWHFSGNEGLYERQEIKLLISFARSVTNFQDSLSLYYLTASEIYQLPIKDLTFSMNYASRKNRSLFYVFSHLSELSDLNEEISPPGREIIERILQDLKYYADLTLQISCGETFYHFVTRSGYLRKLTSHPTSLNEEKVRNIARFFDLVRTVAPVLSNDRLFDFTRHLDLLIQAGDNPAVAEAELTEEAVNVLTVHKAKGLEFPVVIMAGLVSQRFPCKYRREPISLPDLLIRDILPSGNFHLQEERRLFYVGMTRAQKELYFTSALDYGGKRSRKVSPFVLEALNQLKKTFRPTQSSPLEVIERSAPAVQEETGAYTASFSREVISLSYLQIDDYLTCPLKYKYVHILRVPILQHHAVVYGKALHEAIGEFYRRKLAEKKISQDELLTVFEGAWVNEGFMSRPHEKERLKVGRITLQSFYQRASQEKGKPAYVEKKFSFMLENNRIVGRWDLIKKDKEGVHIIDFKSSEVREQKKADRRARESLQLDIYALAYQRVFRTLPDWLELHFLETGLAGRTQPKEKKIMRAIDKIKQASLGIRSHSYPAQPGYLSCRYCAYQNICPQAGRK